MYTCYPKLTSPLHARYQPGPSPRPSIRARRAIRWRSPPLRMMPQRLQFALHPPPPQPKTDELARRRGLVCILLPSPVSACVPEIRTIVSVLCEPGARHGGQLRLCPMHAVDGSPGLPHIAPHARRRASRGSLLYLPGSPYEHRARPEPAMGNRDSPQHWTARRTARSTGRPAHLPAVCRLNGRLALLALLAILALLAPTPTPPPTPQAATMAHGASCLATPPPPPLALQLTSHPTADGVPSPCPAAPGRPSLVPRVMCLASWGRGPYRQQSDPHRLALNLLCSALLCFAPASVFTAIR
jgi:hypothetical protein